MVELEAAGASNAKAEEAHRSFEDVELSQLVDWLLANPGQPFGVPRLRHIVARVERLVIRSALATNDGRRAKTAEQLGITRQGLYN